MSAKVSAIFEKLQLELKDSLESLSCVEVVSASSRNGDIRFLCRAYDEARLLEIVSEFLAKEDDGVGWYSFFGKKYFLHNGKLLYGWVIIFESENLEEAIGDVRTLLAEITGKIAPVAAEATNVTEGALPWSSGYFDKKAEGRVRSLKA